MAISVELGAKVGQNESGQGSCANSPQDPNPNHEVNMAQAVPKRTISPAFQFYPKDFLSSSKVQRMSMAERGVYITLLAHCWLDGSLANSHAVIAKVVGMSTAQFSRLWKDSALAECFTAKNGRLFNERLEDERRKQAEYRRRQAEFGKKGGRPNKKGQPSNGERVAFSEDKAGKGLLSPSPSSSPSFANKDQRESADEPFSAIDDAIEIMQDGQVLFQQLVTAYPAERVTIDHPTLTAFLSALGPSVEWPERFALMLRTLDEHKASEQWRNPRFVPNLITWLSRGDWRGVRKLALASTGTEGRGRTGAPPRGKYDGIEEHD